MAIIFSSPFLNFIQILLLYVSLGSIVAFLLLRDMARITVGGKCEELGIAYIDNNFKILSWKRFFIAWSLASIVAIPLTLFVMMTSV